MDALSVALLLAMVPPATAFPLLYLRSPWRRTAVGRGLMLQAVGMLLLVDVSVLMKLLGGSNPGWLRALTFAVVCAGLWYQLFNLIRLQRCGGHDHRETP